MLMSIPDAQKRRGRPPTGVTPQQGVRLGSELLAALERWRHDQPPPVPARADVIRRIIADRLRAEGYLPASADSAEHIDGTG